MIIDIVLYYGQGRGGLEDVIAKVSRGLKNKGHRVRVFQAYRPQYIEWEEKLDEIYYYGEEIPWGSYLEQYGNGYKKLLESMDKPNIVIATHVPLQSYICHVAVNEGSEKKTPIISWIHGPIDFYGGRNFLQYSDAHLAIGENVMEDLVKTINREKIFVVGNPVEVKNQKIIIDGDENVSFIGDYKWQQEAITNIIKNCIEHNANNGTIYINYEENSLFTKITIRDEGEGIPKEDLKHIFERFYRGKNSSENSVGIGLALAKNIIEKNNGMINCKSELDKGTEFVIKYMK